MIKICRTVLLLIITTSVLFSQVENVPLTSPVYDYLLRAETKGYLEHGSLSDLPLQRKEITGILEKIYYDESASDRDKSIAKFYLREFNIIEEENAVIFENEQFADNVIIDDIFSNKDKYFYRYSDSSSNVEIKPLLKSELFATNSDSYEKNSSFIMQGGARLTGTLSNSFGYYLQATNGSLLSGSRQLALDRESSYGNNVKFAFLDNDLDFTQSHITYENNWFYATIGREVRNLGAGISQNVFISNSSQPFDALSLGAKFKTFEYKFTHGSLLATPDDSNLTQGFNTTIHDKFLVMHRFAFRPSWGEIALWEGVIYSNRSIDFAYINPLSFLKSVEHALRDRDNSMMGLDFTIRPINNFQLKGSFLLDDIIIDEIGNGFWSNKTAWNIAGIYSFDSPIDIGAEYSRVEPYTYSHFNRANSYSTDSGLLGSIIEPNSDYISVMANYWIADKYPLTVRYIRKRHGRNVFEDGELTQNVGGSSEQTRRPDDSEVVEFLDGDLINTSIYQASFGYELFRNFNAKVLYSYEPNNGRNHYFRLIFTLEDF